ncbi:MAG: hypothetical protein IKL25_06125 [Clostridia bacterium]|nr:hypothetical protein [Clostridia bacterium]MBR6667920.1 hypothetical protein [Clostridia bacterium]
MTLEVLFAKAGQVRTFLAMVLLGAGMALLVRLSGLLHRRSHHAGMATDLLSALLLTLLMGQILLRSGDGLRLYALLGLLIGGALCTAGVLPLLGLIARLLPRPKNGSP